MNAIELGGMSRFYAWELQYNKSGEVNAFIERQWDGVNCDRPWDKRVIEVRGSGRARYLVRDRYVDDAGYPNTEKPIVWSDYDGDAIYGDYAVSAVEDPPGTWSMEVDNLMSYLPGRVLGPMS